MKVSVQKEHIERGQCKIAQKCMIAAAIKDSDSSVSYVSVRTNGITITKRRKAGGSVRQHWAVPLKAARAIIRFDAGEPVRPFSFETKLIDEKRIPPVAKEKREKDAAVTRARRAALAAAGEKPPKYGRQARVAGV